MESKSCMTEPYPVGVILRSFRCVDIDKHRQHCSLKPYCCSAAGHYEHTDEKPDITNRHREPESAIWLAEHSVALR